MNTTLKTLYTLCFIIVLSSQVSAQTSEYTYDGNGNMITDQNKDITSIHYNFMNLPDTIIFVDGKKIIYNYTADGKKIRQQVINPSGTTLKTNDYVEDAIYTNNTLREIHHDHGRIVPNASTLWEYQYHIKDHLGNVAMTVSSQANTTEYLATMESEKSTAEATQFRQLTSQVTSLAANHTPGGNEALRLLPRATQWPSMNIAVKKGDVVHMEVYAYYENGAARQQQSAVQGTQTVVENIIKAISAGALISSVENTATETLNPSLAILPGTGNNPYQAHLNFELLNKNYALVDGGFKSISTNANFNQEKLVIGPVKIAETGFLHVYLTNTSAGSQQVYFDDFKVTLTPLPIIQEDRYDPFGMAQEGMHDERYGITKNQHLYNGKEYQEDDLNWYDYSARMYDAALGRWHVNDPLADKYASWSPYQYVLNNPVKFIDPDGKEVVIHRSGNDAVREAKLRKGIEILRQTAEGNRIWSEAEKNGRISIFIAGSEGITGKGKKTNGLTSERPRAYEKNGKININRNESDILLKKFDGLDVSEAKAKYQKPYFIIVNVDDFDAYGIANIIGHEIEAHVNISERYAIDDKTDKNGNIELEGGAKISQGRYEHLLYGNTSIYPNGELETPWPGSSAAKLDDQLKAAKANEAAKTLTQNIANFIQRIIVNW